MLPVSVRKKIGVPTLVLYGDADGIMPLERSGKRIRQAVSGNRVEAVKGVPHGFNVSHAGEFNAASLRFLKA